MNRTAIGLLAVILLVAPSTALAKLPQYSVEILPAAPVAGEPLTVVIRLWDDAAHTQPATWWREATLGGLLEFQDGAERVPVTLTRSDDATFHAEVKLAEGTWRLAIVLQYADISGPADVALATVTVAAAPDPTAPIGAAVIGVALVTAGLIWRGRRRSPSPIDLG